MNIFYLHHYPKIAASMHCDKHCVKMILETAQLLSTAHRELDGDGYADVTGMYKSTHKNHPSAVWVRTSRKHYRWAYDLFVELCKEYTHRYGKVHKTEQKLMSVLKNYPDNCPNVAWSQPPQCMPDQYKQHPNFAVKAYRDYIVNEKISFATKYTNREAPSWISA